MTALPDNVQQEQRLIIVPLGQSPERIDSYLTHQIENATRNKVQQGIKGGMVTVNGKTVKVSYQVQPGDHIAMTFLRPPRLTAQGENIPLDIVYEDDVILVINKAPGMVVHPAFGNYSGTLVNALLYHAEPLSSVNQDLRPGIVHRLDKDTSGLLVVAKNDVAHAFLARQFARHTLEREYWTLAWGKFRNDEGVIEAPLGRSKKDRKKVAVASDGKKAVTEYAVIEQFDFLSLLRVRLRTGRTHQIRVHLSHIGHPVFGDATYGGRNEAWNGLGGKKSQHAANLLARISRQALHAKTIGFIHPITRKPVRFDSELPADMKEVLSLLNAQDLSIHP